MNRKVYIVTYDLKYKWLRNYQGLYNQLQAFPAWMHHLDNTWLIVSEQTPEQIYNLLAPQLGDDCHILITRVTRDYFGLLPEEAWQWLTSHKDLLG